MNQEQRNKIAQELTKRVGAFKCPMCNKGPFSIVDGYFNLSISESMRSINIGGTSIPMTALVCSNCGYVSFHALGAIGLLNKDRILSEDNSKSDEKV